MSHADTLRDALRCPKNGCPCTRGRNVHWRPIPGVDVRYEVSETGEIRSWYPVGRHAPRMGRTQDPRPVALVPNKQRRNYLYFYPRSTDGRRMALSVHRAVALAWLPRDSERNEVNHIDGDKAHNCLWNLEWVSGRENREHARRMGLTRSTLSDEDVRAIRSSAGTNAALGSSYGVDPSVISRIRNGKAYAGV